MLYYNNVIGYHLVYEAGDVNVYPGISTDVVIECWEIDRDHRITYAYTPQCVEDCYISLEEQRQRFFTMHKVTPYRMIWKEIPEDKYERCLQTLQTSSTREQNN